MKNKEIEELLNELKDKYSYEPYDTTGKVYTTISYEEGQLLLSCIQQLEEDNEYLKRLCETQNKREYRSKFLKEFQKEHGKNVFPDYDEIYKRYDKLKEENKILKENAEHNDKVVDKTNWEINILKNNRDKAIEYIENMPYLQETDKEYEDINGNTYFTYKEWNDSELLNILKGDSDE